MKRQHFPAARPSPLRSKQLEKLFPADIGLPENAEYRSSGQVFSLRNDNQARRVSGLEEGSVTSLAALRSILETGLPQRSDQLTGRKGGKPGRHTATRNDVVQRWPLRPPEIPSSATPKARAFSRYSSTASCSMAAACSTELPHEVTPSSGQKETKPLSSSQITAVNSTSFSCFRSAISRLPLTSIAPGTFACACSSRLTPCRQTRRPSC